MMNIKKYARMILIVTALTVVNCQGLTPVPATAAAVPLGAVPTEEPQAATGYTSAPMLSGKVRACDVSDGLINFELLEPRPELVGFNAVVTLNGVAVDCTVLSYDDRLLSCPLPPTAVTFPVEVTAAIGDAMTDQFTYDGAECH
jgi:hypothetical protein